MHAEALRLTRLVEDLGKLAEAQQPGLTQHKQPLDLRELVDERARVYEDYLQEKGIALDQRRSRRSPSIFPRARRARTSPPAR